MSQSIVLDRQFEAHIRRPLRVLYLGMPDGFSIPPLEALLRTDALVCGVLIPGESIARTTDQPAIERVVQPADVSPLPLVDPFVSRTIVQIAWRHAIPVYRVRRLSDKGALDVVRLLQPDIGCVACFPKRIPSELLALPRYGCVNIHPALLPAHRGPVPLFWTFRNGETTTGVTIHIVEPTLDTGDILFQETLDLPDGISGPEAERRCALLGAQLLIRTVETLRQGSLQRRAQATGGSYEGLPSQVDFRLDTTWSARRAFNFMRGTADWGQPYLVEVDGTRLVLTTAHSYASDATLGKPYRHAAQDVYVQFRPGVLRAQIG